MGNAWTSFSFFLYRRTIIGMGIVVLHILLYYFLSERIFFIKLLSRGDTFEILSDAAIDLVPEFYGRFLSGSTDITTFIETKWNVKGQMPLD